MMKQSEFQDYMSTLLSDKDKQRTWEMKTSSPRKHFDNQLLSNCLLEEFQDTRAKKEAVRTTKANQAWNIKNAKRGHVPLHKYVLPTTKALRNDATKEYSQADEVPPGTGADRKQYNSRSPHRQEKDYVNVAHMIYDYQATQGGSQVQKAKLKQKVAEGVFNRETDFASLPSVAERMSGPRRTPSVKFGPRHRTKTLKPPTQPWIFNSTVPSGKAETSRPKTKGEITFVGLLKAQQQFKNLNQLPTPQKPDTSSNPTSRRRSNKSAAIELKQGLQKTRSEQEYDAVYISELLHHMQNKNIPLDEIEKQSKTIDKLLLKKNSAHQKSKSKAADAKVFDLTKVDPKKNEDINSSDGSNDEEPSVLSQEDLIFPNYLVGEDGNKIHGLNLNIEQPLHMREAINTKIGFANYQLSKRNSSFVVPKYMQKPLRLAPSEQAASQFDKYTGVSTALEEDAIKQSLQSSQATHPSAHECTSPGMISETDGRLTAAIYNQVDGNSKKVKSAGHATRNRKAYTVRVPTVAPDCKRPKLTPDQLRLLSYDKLGDTIQTEILGIVPPHRSGSKYASTTMNSAELAGWEGSRVQSSQGDRRPRNKNEKLSQTLVLTGREIKSSSNQRPQLSGRTKLVGQLVNQGFAVFDATFTAQIPSAFEQLDSNQTNRMDNADVTVEHTHLTQRSIEPDIGDKHITLQATELLRDPAHGNLAGNQSMQNPLIGICASGSELNTNAGFSEASTSFYAQRAYISGLKREWKQQKGYGSVFNRLKKYREAVAKAQIRQQKPNSKYKKDEGRSGAPKQQKVNEIDLLESQFRVPGLSPKAFDDVTLEQDTISRDLSPKMHAEPPYNKDLPKSEPEVISYDNQDGEKFKVKETTLISGDTSIPKELQQMSDLPESTIGSQPHSPATRHKEFTARRNSQNPSRLAEAKKEEVRLLKQAYKKDVRKMSTGLELCGNQATLNEPIQNQNSGTSMPPTTSDRERARERDTSQASKSIGGETQNNPTFLNSLYAQGNVRQSSQNQTELDLQQKASVQGGVLTNIQVIQASGSQEIPARDSQRTAERHEIIGILGPEESKESIDKPQFAIIIPATERQQERQSIKIITGQADLNKDDAPNQIPVEPTESSMKNLGTIDRRENHNKQDGQELGEPLKAAEATTTIIRLQTQNTQDKAAVICSTEISQFTSPDKQSLIPQLVGLPSPNQGSLENTNRATERSPQEVLPNTMRDALIKTNTFRDSIARQTNIESNRDKLSELNVDLDMPIQKQSTEQKKSVTHNTTHVTEKSKSVERPSQSKISVTKGMQTPPTDQERSQIQNLDATQREHQTANVQADSQNNVSIGYSQNEVQVQPQQNPTEVKISTQRVESEAFEELKNNKRAKSNPKGVKGVKMTKAMQLQFKMNQAAQEQATLLHERQTGGDHELYRLDNKKRSRRVSPAFETGNESAQQSMKSPSNSPTYHHQVLHVDFNQARESSNKQQNAQLARNLAAFQKRAPMHVLQVQQVENDLHLPFSSRGTLYEGRNFTQQQDLAARDLDQQQTAMIQTNQRPFQAKGNKVNLEVSCEQDIAHLHDATGQVIEGASGGDQTTMIGAFSHNRIGINASTTSTVIHPGPKIVKNEVNSSSIGNSGEPLSASLAIQPMTPVGTDGRRTTAYKPQSFGGTVQASPTAGEDSVNFNEESPRKTKESPSRGVYH